jgi:predicted kinase
MSKPENRNNQKIILCIGLPGSGKTFWAQQQIAAAKFRGEIFVRVNNDDIRDELNGGPFDHSVWTPKFESEVRKIRLERIANALKDGFSVIVDNTHLNEKTLKSLKTWAFQNFPHVFIEEKDFRDVPFQTCLERDAARMVSGERGVGPEVIMKMAKGANLIPEVTPYPVDWKLPWTIICDLDGTLALFGNRRNPYDASNCDFTDEPNLTVLSLLKSYQGNYRSGHIAWPNVSKTFFFSGRTDKYKDPTIRFLLNKCNFDVVGDSYFELVMRKTGDSRADEIIKKEMFDEHIRGKYNVFVIIDDRNKVCRMWRSLGLPLFQVGTGEEF